MNESLMDRRKFVKTLVSGVVMATGLGIERGSAKPEEEHITEEEQEIVSDFADRFIQLCADFNKRSVTANEMVGAVKVTDEIDAYLANFAKASNMDPQKRTPALEKEALALAQTELLRRSSGADQRAVAVFSAWVLLWNQRHHANMSSDRSTYAADE